MSKLTRNEKLALVRVLRGRDGDNCCWCGVDLIEAENLPPMPAKQRLPYNYPTLEHLEKRANGGKDVPINLKLSCPSCNETRDKRESFI